MFEHQEGGGEGGRDVWWEGANRARERELFPRARALESFSERRVKEDKRK